MAPAGITLAQAEEQLIAWLNASKAVAKGQHYKIGERQLTRANAAEIQQQITFWDAKVRLLSRGGRRSYRAVPI